MKKAIALLSLCLAVAFSQQVYPASTNPDGASYFAPSLVRTMNISTTVTGTVTPGYQEFIQVWIPSYVGAVRYILNNTVPSGGEGNYIEIHVSMIESDFDSSVSFPCSSTSGNAACDDYDLYIDAYTNSWDSSVVDVIDEDYIPGTWHYITVYTYYTSGSDVTYALRVEPAFACAENSTVAILDSDELGCVDNSTITHVASNGAAFAGALLSDSQFDIYRVEIPQNVSRVWAWLTGSFSYNYFIVNQGVASVDYYYGSIAYQSSGSSVGNGFYTFRVEVELPTYNLPLFFSVVPYSSSYLGSYNVTFHWSYCGSTFAGLGEDSNDYDDAVTTFPDTPDCNDPITVPALNGTSLQTVNFAIEAYNATEDYGYVGSYGFMHIPDGSYGSVNFTCNSTSDETFVTFTKGKPSSCYSDYTYYIYCNGPTYTTSNYFRLLSEDLYVGGYWSVAACSDDSVASTVSLLSNGYFPLPSPSASPSASVTPSSSASSSASPSATPSVSSSPEPDSDSSAFVFPAILMVALAVIISL